MQPETEFPASPSLQAESAAISHLWFGATGSPRAFRRDLNNCPFFFLAKSQSFLSIFML